MLLLTCAMFVLECELIVSWECGKHFPWKWKLSPMPSSWWYNNVQPQHNSHSDVLTERSEKTVLDFLLTIQMMLTRRRIPKKCEDQFLASLSVLCWHHVQKLRKPSNDPIFSLFSAVVSSAPFLHIKKTLNRRENTQHRPNSSSRRSYRIQKSTMSHRKTRVKLG